MQEKKEKERREAMDRTVRTPAGSIAIPSDFQRFWRQEDSPELHPALQAVTRLAQPSVDLVLLHEGSPLGPKGGNPPGRDHLKELLLNSVSVSSRLAVPALFSLTVPAAFAASAALRRHRLLTLDSDGKARAEGVVFTYDSDLGLEITREGDR
jgi:hypothetical protein